jgi:hypothetical protein
VVFFLTIFIHISIDKLVQVIINSSFDLIRLFSLLANNIFLRFIFKKDIHRESLPETISVILNTFIENLFLEKSPSTISSNDVTPIQSNVLKFTFDQTNYQSYDGDKTIVTYCLVGVGDFGCIVQKISIWQDQFDLSVLSTVQLKDDVRQWNEQYQQTMNIFKKRDDPTKECHFFPITDIPVTNDGHTGNFHHENFSLKC